MMIREVTSTSAPLPSVLVAEHELVRRRVMRAIKQRRRYRYAKPTVQTVEAAWLISSPCCSRNIDPEGGVIAIARIERLGEDWRLFRYDYTEAVWVLYGEYLDLDALLRVICVDKERLFWP